MGVRARVVGLVEEACGGVFVDAGYLGLDGDGEAVAAAAVARADADVDGDGGVLEGEFLAAGDAAQGAVEARGVAGGEQWLGVGEGAAGPAHLLGDGEVDVQDAVAGADVSGAAVS